VADRSTVGAVILAAGSSRRLGRPKQLLLLEGKPLIGYVVDLALAAELGEIVVVLGHEHEAVRGALGASVRTVVNEDHAAGQGSSLRVGIEALGDRITRAVVLLGDQPHVPLDAVVAVSEGPGPIRRARYRGTFGHPVAFDRDWWGELTRIDGDRGARDLLTAQAALVQAVDVDVLVPRDVDTPEDAQALGAD
jgi:molybdenum cofactor cytidylyltransferase